MMLHNNLSINEKGNLAISGFDTVELANKYGTPLYVLDTDYVLNSCLKYKNLIEKYFGEGSKPLFASKALSCMEIYRIAKKAGIGIDVVSGGEIYTANKAGFPMENAYFHGNNKTDADIKFALDSGVGCFVVDNLDELAALQKETSARGVTVRAMLRVSPGIDPHTHKAVVTGSVDSKFGVAIETGQAMETVKALLACDNIQFEGLHCHIGSQIFDYNPFAEAADIMIRFIADVKKETGVTVSALNLGGGFGVKYTDEDADFDYEKVLSDIASSLEKACADCGVSRPRIYFEPGRSMVAAAGLTLYTVGSFKTITGYKSYVSIDGGLPDNPRYALYQSKYTCLIANKAGEEKTIRATVAGRCCESGDLIQEDVALQPCKRGDVLAVLVTGAYNYSMASNYNRLPRPAMVGVGEEGDRIIIRRESYDDIVKNDI
ncbi:MAG: diaminopimelate decarboxylase [Clostridia bacterium]|nr:diaminopimelate decarboxylase [Clostridia bacterium]